MTLSEERFLVEQAQADPQQFDLIYRQFVDEIYRFIYYKTNAKETAEDLTAQVFMQALEHLATFRYQVGARFSSWLYRIAHNQVVDHYRRQRPTTSLEEIEPLPQAETTSSTVDSHLQQQHIQALLQQLPKLDQEILHLRLWQDKSYSEIAAILQSNTVAVRARYSRALKKFKQLYSAHYETQL